MDRISTSEPASPRGDGGEDLDAMSLERMEALQAAFEADFPLLAAEIGDAIEVKKQGGIPSPTRLASIQSALYDFPQTANALGVDRDGSSKRRRREALCNVYREFDVDNDGSVGTEEMLALGRCRQELGHKDREWTPEMNQQMMFNMGASMRNGIVAMQNFVNYFDERLPRDPDAFAAEITSFM